MTDQNDDGKNSNKPRHPSVTDEASGAGISGGDSPLKKGPWSADEDKLLQEYVRDNGARNWDSIKMCTRLRRDGKSCRLRWLNQLRPDLKKHAITRDEKQLIAKLNAQMGNKWAKIAAQLPGRTGNEIKNYWNGRERRWNEPLNQAVGQWIPNADFGNLNMRSASMSRETFGMTDQNDDGKNSNKPRHPSVTDEASGAGISGGDSPLKKGPWSADEDKILQEYVQKHGEESWNSVSKNAGLHRSGYSCRSRWLYQLRPGLKKSAITRDEEQCIGKLHAQMGNEWAKIAEQLPGRTDHEIGRYWKKYWKVRERRLKIGNVPLNQAGSQGCQNTGTVQPLGQWIPNANFDMRAASRLQQGISSPNSQFFAFPTLRLRESETKSAGEKITEPIDLCPQYDSDLTSTYDITEPGVLPGHRVLPNDYTSFSEPVYGPLNLELPSFQYSETQQDSWRLPSFLQPSFQPAFDTSIQYPPVEQIQSEHRWPINRGLLLDTYLYEPNSEQPLQRPFVQQDPEASFSYADAAGRSFISSVQAEQNTPFLGPSASPLFSESSPISRGSSYDIDWFSSQDQASAQLSEAKAKFEQMHTGHNVLPDSWSFSLRSFEPPDDLIHWTNSGLLDSVLYRPNFVPQYPGASFSQTDAAERSFITPSQANPNMPSGQSASSLSSERTPIRGTSSSYDPGFFVNHEAVVDQALTQQPEEKSTSEQTDIDVIAR